MKIFITLSILVYSFQVYSQDNDCAKYLTNINTAELAVCDSNYVLALEYYKTAFSFNKTPFSHDYYNALLCAVSVKKYDDAFSFMHKLANKGVQKKYFVENEHILVLQNQKQWNDFIKSLDNRNNNTFNTELVHEYEKMVEIDQKTNRARYY